MHDDLTPGAVGLGWGGGRAEIRQSPSSLEVSVPQRVRLNILEATDGPTIWEFQLYP